MRPTGCRGFRVVGKDDDDGPSDLEVPNSSATQLSNEVRI
jgi:hypothetical protein